MQIGCIDKISIFASSNNSERVTNRNSDEVSTNIINDNMNTNRSWIKNKKTIRFESG